MDEKRKLTRRSAFLALATLTGAAFGFESVRPPGASGYPDTLSFDMWCLEMRLYSPERCDERRPADVTAYERYRLAAERQAQERAAKDERERELKQHLDPDPAKRR